MIHHSFGRREDLFPNPDDFRPDRFLPPNETPKDAWRPFERGPRSCLGQELAMMEMKIILLLNLRSFDFESGYTEEGPSVPGFGGRAYQMILFSPKPSEGLPMKVRARKV